MKRFLAAAAAVCLASPALAQGFGGASQSAMDLNHDGQISRAEAQAARSAAFERLDADHDGYLSASERAGAGRMMQFILGNADSDGDGRVSRAELMAQPYLGFDRLDANHDGMLSGAELQSARQRQAGG
jgi:hypothetical protein